MSGLPTSGFRGVGLRAAAFRPIVAGQYVATRFGTFDLVAVRDRLSIIGVVVVAWFMAYGGSWISYDSYAYWAVHPRTPYLFDYSPDQYGAFRYSPALAQLFAVFRFVPWPVFAIAWMVFLSVVLAWMGRRWTLAALAFAPVAWDIYMGNIEILMAAAILLSFRWPGAWAFLLLTKVTPGIGLLWYVARREWRNLFIALGVTGAIVGVSFALTPHLWFQWPHELMQVGGRPTGYWVLLRTAGAALLIIWGARTDRRWTLIVGCTLALAWLDLKTSAMLVGLVAFLPRLPGDEPGVLDELGVARRRQRRR